MHRGAKVAIHQQNLCAGLCQHHSKIDNVVDLPSLGMALATTTVLLVLVARVNKRLVLIV